LQLLLAPFARHLCNLRAVQQERRLKTGFQRRRESTAKRRIDAWRQRIGKWRTFIASANASEVLDK
jgi:hypothetical protein